jgi:hypothetical protein
LRMPAFLTYFATVYLTVETFRDVPFFNTFANYEKLKEG